MAKKLIIDLQKCTDHDLSDVKCSYKHHPENNGMQILLEKIYFALICRKCNSAPCINACPQNALEKVPAENDDESILKRANMLCTACGTCAIACPFGTIYTDLIPFAANICDLCKGRLSQKEKPLCVRTCSDECIDYKDIKKVEGDFVEVFENIVAKVPAGSRWQPFLRETESK